MDNLFVVNNPKDWRWKIPDAEMVSARQYLTDPAFGQLRRVRVFNINKSYRYQSVGYYVSLLATARGHRPVPTVSAIQDMKSATMLRFASEELEELIQKSLAPIQSDEFTLSIYFGHNLAKRYERLAWNLFMQFPAPMVRAQFVKEDGVWELQSIRPIAGADVPESHWQDVIRFASNYTHPSPRQDVTRFDLAILQNEKEKTRPSNEKALAKFEKAAEKLGFYVEFIEKEDYGRIAEFDALFIRETTNVNHHTYRFSQRAKAEGLVVMDDPESILKCSNKVFLAELLTRHKVPIPKTWIIHRQNIETLLPELQFPLILKQPDSSFSQGVFKVNSSQELEAALEDLLEKSDLIIAQEFIPTDFDWRVGIVNKKPLYVCKYYMARKNWKIQHTDAGGETQFGKVETFAVENAPERVVQTALKAANLIGDGLYGVDLKEIGKRVLVIEINDNPSIDSGFEDHVLKDELYHQIMQVFLERVEMSKGKGRGDE